MTAITTIPRTVVIEITLKSPAEKFWNALKKSSTIFPKALPNIYRKIKTLKGDGKSVGSVRMINYVEGKTISSAKERIDSIDEEGKTISYSMIDGDITKFYENFKYSIRVVPKGDGCVVIWSSEFKIVNSGTPINRILRDFTIMNLQYLDAYLLNN